MESGIILKRSINFGLHLQNQNSLLKELRNTERGHEWLFFQSSTKLFFVFVAINGNPFISSMKLIIQ